jgi:hypothetical protein
MASASSGYGPIMFSCEYGNVPSVSIGWIISRVAMRLSAIQEGHGISYNRYFGNVLCVILAAIYIKHYK